MCVSVGFASWVVTGGSNALALGSFEADDFTVGSSGQNLDVIQISNLSDYQYATGYGFVNNGVYAETTNLTGSCLFNVQNGKNCFTSFRNDKSFALDVTLTTSNSFGGFSTNNISMTSISLSSTNFISSSHDTINNGTDITTTFNITCADYNEDFTFSFLLTLSWGGSNLSSFPNLSNSNFNIAFLPKESA